MAERESDATLPLPDLSQLCADNTVDEDIIPTSQPQSSNSSKTLKKSDLPLNEFIEEKTVCTIPVSQLSLSTSDVTVPVDLLINQSLDKDKSSDFIPETDTKKRKIEYSKENLLCRKKLPVNDDFSTCTEDIFESHLGADVSKIPGNLAVDTQNIVIASESLVNGHGEPKNVFSCTGCENEKKSEESVSEILVDESAETVDLEASENSFSLAKKLELEKMNSEKTKSLDSDIERCEETQIFDSSSILLVDQPGTLTLETIVQKKPNSVGSENLYLEETIEDQTCETQGKVNDSTSVCSPPKVVQMLEESIAPELSIQATNITPNGDINGIKEVSLQKVDPALKSLYDQLYSPWLETKKLDFKLLVSCVVTVNTKTKKVAQKFLANVSELPSHRSKQKLEENISDNTSDKSKRYSTSSSGSVYSDKNGLPFNLPKRMSTLLNQTDGSDSSEEGQTKRLLLDGKKLSERTPWCNEYLFPLKIDELVAAALESQDFVNKTPNPTSPKKPKKKSFITNNSPEEKSECLSSERTSSSNFNGEILNSLSEEIQNEEHEIEKLPETPKKEEAVKEVVVEVQNNEESEVVEQQNEVPEKAEVAQKQNEDSISLQKPAGYLGESNSNLTEKGQKTDVTISERDILETNQDEDTAVQLSDDLPVFARWTDKRYYSGVLFGALKNDRWNIKFDDGTVKAVKEDSLIPTKWLKAGELVFALVDDKYQSGQIITLKHGKETKYVVELDEEKREIEVKVSDMCLSEVMAALVKEKYKPFSRTPQSKTSSHIDFDNVVSGKRHREQRTPLRPTSGFQAGSSGAKKKVSTKSKTAGDQEESNKKTPQKKSFIKEPENSYFVEDKVVSAESPGNEAGETPQRGNVKGQRRKAIPKSLSYETVETPKSKWSDWVNPDGTPIPGPSGVKAKRRTSKSSNTKLAIIKPVKLPSVEEENITPKKTSGSSLENSLVEEKRSSSKKGKKAKRSPEAGENPIRSTGKRKLNIEEPDKVQTKTVKRDVQKKKTRSRK